MNLSEKLTSLRKKKGLTQLDLAEKLNVSRQAVSRWEVGTAVPSTDNLKVLGELYGVSVDFLLNDNAEDPCTDTENQQPEPKEQDGEANSVKRGRVLVFICALFLAAASILICVTAVQSRKQKQPVPIGEMDTALEDEYPVGSFSIGW